MARITVWEDLASPDQAYVALVSQYLAPALAAFALTGIAAAAMSTTDSLLLMAGSALAHDLVRKCVDEPRGVEREERSYVWISRWAIVAVGAVAFVLAIPDVALILRIVSFAVAIIGAAFFFPLIAGMVSSRVSAEAALASSVCGVDDHADLDCRNAQRPGLGAIPASGHTGATGGRRNDGAGQHLYAAGRCHRRGRGGRPARAAGHDSRTSDREFRGANRAARDRDRRAMFVASYRGRGRGGDRARGDSK